MWDVAQGQKVAVLRGHKSKPVNSVVWSRDSQTIVSGGDDWSACVWRVGAKVRDRV
jgi:WD40 repeat protein